MAIEIAREGEDMFGPFRGFPFRGLFLVAVGFMAASVLAGGAPGAVAGLALVPLFLFKMLFVFFMFGALFRLAGAGGGWGPGRARWHGRDRGSPAGRDDREFDRERWEWEESLRQAREELREYDTTFSPPPEGFEPPADERAR